MLGDWLILLATLSMKNTELEEVIVIVEAYLLGEMRTFTSPDTEVIENNNSLRYPKEMLEALSQGSALTHHRPSFKKKFISMLILNFAHKMKWARLQNQIRCVNHDKQHLILGQSPKGCANEQK